MNIWVLNHLRIPNLDFCKSIRKVSFHLMTLAHLSRIFLLLGVIFLAVGGLIFLISRLGISLQDLPGNIRVEGQNFTCIFALGISLLLSLLFTVGINLLLRIINR